AIAAFSGQAPLTSGDAALTPTPTRTPVPRGTYVPAVIVLLTDGENTADADPLAAVQTVVDSGIRVYTVGIGSAEGATLQLDGFTVRTRLDEATLRQIAERTGGAYYNAQNAEELRTIYDQIQPELVLKAQQTEVTSVFAGASLLIMLIGGTLSLLWLGRLP
ncbi:MAG TPA: VWA domain-containing protein, partial [Herpetosiphonaceae bacterium]|nr:VWA domain-containing protein [Herpetosiphonaceae bacterium]